MTADRAWRARLEQVDPVEVRGRVTGVRGLAIRCQLPVVRLGDAVRVHRQRGEPLLAEVVAFDESAVTLLPLGEPHGVGPEDPVERLPEPWCVPFGAGLLGRVVDPLGRPLDAGGPLEGAPWPVMRPAPSPLTRPRVSRVLEVGIRAIDGLTTLGEGQRVGLFAGSGVGKSQLLGQMARQAQADVCVLGLVGERGREVGEFLDDALGPEGRKRAVVVCATSDAPALVRMRSAHAATAIAEGFRDQGLRVLLLVDSLTRFARAAREVGLAAGEPPVRRGYPPSVLSLLPALLERAGQAPRGSITALYTVLVEGDDMDDPIADEVRGLLDGHLVLSRRLAARGHFPALDVRHSLSRVMDKLISPEQREHAARVRADLAIYEDKRDLVTLGAYVAGSDPHLDAALARMEAIERFLQQGPRERSEFEATLHNLATLTTSGDAVRPRIA